VPSPPPNPDDDLYLRRRRRLGYYFPPAQIIAIFALVITLVAIVALKDSCANGVGNLFRAFDVAPDGGARPPGDAGPRPR
jgi:hypothetical protein